MKVGSIVTHKEYPGQTGKVVAKTKRWSGGDTLQIILVRWGASKHCSRHIPSALCVKQPRQ